MLDGGGIVASDVTGFSVLRCTLEDNHAGANGGAIAVRASSVEIVATTMRNNVAIDDGGAMHVDSDSTVTVQDLSLIHI